MERAAGKYMKGLGCAFWFRLGRRSERIPTFREKKKTPRDVFAERKSGVLFFFLGSLTCGYVGFYHAHGYIYSSALEKGIFLFLQKKSQLVFCDIAALNNSLRLYNSFSGRLSAYIPAKHYTSNTMASPHPTPTAERQSLDTQYSADRASTSPSQRSLGSASLKIRAAVKKPFQGWTKDALWAKDGLDDQYNFPTVRRRGVE